VSEELKQHESRLERKNQGLVRMRICMFVSNDLVNEPRVTRHAETLGKSGHTVRVTCTKSDRTPDFERRDNYSITRVSLSLPRTAEVYSQRRLKVQLQREDSILARLPLLALAHSLELALGYSLRLAFVSILLTCKLAKCGRAINAHVYVSSDLDTLFAGALCAGASRKLIYDAHELWPDQFVGTAPSPLIAAFRILESVLLKRVDAVITVNEFISNELEVRYKIRKPYVVLNVPKKELRVPPETIRPCGTKTVLYQGAYQVARGLENLVRACQFLRDDVTLVLRGYGPIESELREIAKDFGNCRFDGPVPASELVLAASSADLGVIPYGPVHLDNYFASPNKLFEYIQAGLPVVASDLPFLRKIIAENQIGYLFDPRHPRSIADAINAATTEENLRILKANVRRIKDRYSWEEEQTKLLTIIRDECSRLP
jgi:glycosyltransferase involved in cell wall biosynthesis